MLFIKKLFHRYGNDREEVTDTSYACTYADDSYYASPDNLLGSDDDDDDDDDWYSYDD